jgi:protein-S-isoprenylcysteine O-methyltransferase Ste14
MTVLAILAIAPASVPLYFWLFWSKFDFFRRHPALAYTLMLGVLGGGIAAAIVLREPLLSVGVAMPVAVRVLGWIVIAAAMLFGTIADRQIGFRVRAFVPFFEDGGRIELVTSGAYRVVRHPIYASGLWFQVGVALVTGYAAVAIACLIFTLGALWFTRQEERRLVTLLADPTEYDRYRAKVPALFPGL